MRRVTNGFLAEHLERRTKEGKSPVGERTRTEMTCPRVPRDTRNPVGTGRTTSKAKYRLATDSAEYREGKVKSTPEGE